LVDRLVERVDQVLGNASSPGVVINVGGALVGLGSCPQSFEFPPGLSLRPAPCSRGAPGLVMRVANATNAPVLHIINIRRLALDLGLPFDPKPLPEPGVNPSVYGSGTQKTNKALVGGNL
jgi:poly-gamma-glutamate system protein